MCVTSSTYHKNSRMPAQISFTSVRMREESVCLVGSRYVAHELCKIITVAVALHTSPARATILSRRLYMAVLDSRGIVMVRHDFATSTRNYRGLHLDLSLLLSMK